MFCSYCKKKQRVGSKYCSQCGYLLDIRCSKCSGRLEAVARFCTKCGHKLTDNTYDDLSEDQTLNERNSQEPQTPEASAEYTRRSMLASGYLFRAKNKTEKNPYSSSRVYLKYIYQPESSSYDATNELCDLFLQEISYTPIIGKTKYQNSIERYRDTDYFGVGNKYQTFIILEETDDYLDYPYGYQRN